MVVLLRMPCLQEDEGNIHPVGVFPTLAGMAMFLRDDQTIKPYFQLSDYVYVGGLSGPEISDEDLKKYVPRMLDFQRFHIREK